MLGPPLALLVALAAPALVNDIPYPEFIGAPLSGESLSANEAITATLAADPSSQTSLAYLVQCALPAGASVHVETPAGSLDFDGLIGLAPEWADAPCDVACQEWVTACMLARINAYGVHFSLFARGAHPELAPEGPDELAEAARYTVEEGAFYGNMFTDPPRVFACRGRGEDPLALTLRACTLPGSRCGIEVVGPCGPVAGDPEARAACGEPTAEGFYPRCRARAVAPGASAPPDAAVYERVVTTWLRPTAFQAGLEAPLCEAPVDPPGFPEPVAESRAGDRCSNEDTCVGELLSCDPRLSGGLCTAPCDDSGDAEDEAASCGGDGSTCLRWPNGRTLCTRACTVGRAGGDCGPGRVCTLPWPVVPPEAPRLPGCLPFCSDDADCNAGARCHRPLGECLAALPEGGRRDGDPCDPRGPTDCAGLCWRVGADPAEGLCASLINGALDPHCLDPDVRPQGPRAADDLALCLFRTCADDADCTAPLTCRVVDGARVCAWP